MGPRRRPATRARTPPAPPALAPPGCRRSRRRLWLQRRLRAPPRALPPRPLARRRTRAGLVATAEGGAAVAQDRHGGHLAGDFTANRGRVCAAARVPQGATAQTRTCATRRAAFATRLRTLTTAATARTAAGRAAAGLLLCVPQLARRRTAVGAGVGHAPQPTRHRTAAMPATAARSCAAAAAAAARARAATAAATRNQAATNGATTTTPSLTHRPAPPLPTGTATAVVRVRASPPTRPPQPSPRRAPTEAGATAPPMAATGGTTALTAAVGTAAAPTAAAATTAAPAQAAATSTAPTTAAVTTTAAATTAAGGSRRCARSLGPSLGHAALACDSVPTPFSRILAPG